MLYSLKFYLKERLRELEKNHKFLNFRIKKCLNKILTPEVITGVKNIKYFPQTSSLVLKVFNPIFAQEIKNQEEEIKQEINKSLGKEVIRKIIIKLE
jgi:uncharacterized Fe-S cluster-containing radical SAM superfamily protein